MKYVIWLTSASEYKCSLNAYGYWAGKNYTVVEELIPVTDNIVTERTKIYTSKVRADRGLDACLNRGYAYVLSGEVRELN